MKNLLFPGRLALLAAGTALMLTACMKDELAPGTTDLTDQQRTIVKSYDLESRADPGISGTVSFIAKNGWTQVVIELQGTQNEHFYPAHIHFNSAVEGGGIAISLDPVNGSSGKSKTKVSYMDSGNPITYEQLLMFDGYVNVHMSASDLNTLVATGDIGGNALTGNFELYPLSEKAVPGISGMAAFRERENGNTLVMINLDGTPPGGTHPAHIHNNSAAVGGGIAISLDDVDGTSGKSRTNIRMKDNAMPITYTDLINFDGYINVHMSVANLGTIVAQGDVGSNFP